MRRLFMMIFLLGAYLWAVTSGHDQFLLAQGKAVYRWVAHWLEDAEADFQVGAGEKHKDKSQRSRRWN